MRLVDAFVPIWFLAAVGYAARRWNVLGETAAIVLARFVFYFAMPAALFLDLSVMPLSGFTGRPLIAFGVSGLAVLAAAWLGFSRWCGRKRGDRPIWAMAAGYVNSANLGIPVARQVLGSLSFLAEIILFQVLVLTPIILVALDRHAGGGPVRLRRIASLPVRNPVIIGSVAGVACSAARWHPPAVAVTSLNMLALAAVPTALVALGASLYTPRRVAVGRTELGVITVLKLFAQPALGYLTGLLLHLTTPQLLAVVVCAGLPTAQNTFIFAQEYGIAEDLASRAVMVTTSLALVTLLAAAALLG